MPWGTRSRLSWFGSAAGAALIAAACAQILDTNGIVVVGSKAPPPPPPGAPPACQPEQLQCVGAALQVCRDDQSGFRTARVCSTPDLCCTDPGACPQPGCQAPACAAGDFHCDGATLQLCNDGQTGWTAIATCPSSAQCNASLGRCTDQPCSTVGPDLQCSAGNLLGCTGSDWFPLGISCATEGLCSATSANRGCKPNGCQVGSMSPGPFRCDNVDLLRCNDEQTGFDFVETCLNAVHCNGLIDVTGPEANLSVADLRRLGCSPPACTPGHYACSGSRLMLCNQDRTGYTITVQDCGSPGKCDASSGQCQAVDCTPLSHQCSGSQRQVCSADHTWQKLEDCASAALCDPSACQPPTCTSSDYRCNGATLERCNVNGDGWIPIHDCVSDKLCDAPAKRCEPPVCDTDQRRCNRQGQLELCSPSRDAWVLQRDCRLEANLPATASPEQLSGVCDLTGPGQCQNPPACPSAALRCNTQFLERCQSGAWQPIARCASAGLCDATGTGACHDPVCAPGSYQCVTPGSIPLVAGSDDSKRGLTLQGCNSAGSAYVTLRDCPSDNYCDGVHGQCDICDPLQLFCFDGDLYRCSADGQERELEKRCRSGCQNPIGDAGTPPGGTPATGQPACTEDLLHD